MRSFDVEVPYHEDDADVVKNEQPKGSDAQPIEIVAALIEIGGGHGRFPVVLQVSTKLWRSAACRALLVQMHLLGFVRPAWHWAPAAPPTPQCDAGAFKVDDRLGAWIKNAADCTPFARTAA